MRAFSYRADESQGRRWPEARNQIDNMCVKMDLPGNNILRNIRTRYSERGSTVFKMSLFR
jgi:hypothetical protein